jgi:hypothetical protein
MTDQAMEEIAREAFAGGQKAFQFQALPFRITAQNMVAYRSDPNIAFWRQLKEGSDRFEATGEEPIISVSEKRYVFAPSKDPEREARAVARRAQEEARITSLTEAGTIAAMRTTYADGGQHRSFAALIRQGASVGLLSRPEALAFAPREIVITLARPVQHVEVASPKPDPAELSVFGPTLLGYEMAQLIYNRPLIAGSMEVLAPGLNGTPLTVAVQR